jgi:hypothetical protein
MESLWLVYSLVTVACWGLYGLMLHGGQLAMADPVHGRYKAFLFVGVAYFLLAVLAPLGMLLAGGAKLEFPGKGIGLSLFAGALGAAGAFAVLLAFGAKGSPAVVMSIVFGGAPVVNAMAAFALHPPQNAAPPQFYLGIALAALGGALVTLYKPT